MIDLIIIATNEEAILRRDDIYDRSPILNWGQGRVTLFGDVAYAMQSNLGQGGFMAIKVCLPIFDLVHLDPVSSVIIMTYSNITNNSFGAKYHPYHVS